MKKPIEIIVTTSGFEKLKNEQADLMNKRPGVLERLVAAREQGDLSENAGYHAAKEELSRIDSRLRELAIMLRYAEIIESSQSETVEIGTKVTVESMGQRQTFSIVGNLEADPTSNKLSIKSPIGAALVGKGLGDKVEVDTPSGKISFKIYDIQPG